MLIQDKLITFVGELNDQSKKATGSGLYCKLQTALLLRLKVHPEEHSIRDAPAQ